MQAEGPQGRHDRVVTVAEELELKYDLTGDAELPTLLAALNAAAAGAPVASAVLDEAGGPDALSEVDAGVHELEAVYFDTTDLRLAAARITLRRRSGGADEGWHLKLPSTGGARQERRVPLGRAVRTVPVALRRLVEDVSEGAALVPVARLRTSRSLRHLLGAGGRVLLELADDRVEGRRLLPPEGAAQDAAASMTWREAEVEVVEGDRGLLEAVDAGLRAAGVQPSGSSSKVARVLAGPAADDRRDSTAPATEPDTAAPAAEPPAATEPPEVAAPRPRLRVKRLKVTARSSAGDVVLLHLGEQVEQVLDQDPRVRADVADSVHKMRVATRRLRSALKTFQPLFASSTRPLREELKWLAAELGAARDAEVLRERLTGAVSELDGEATAGEATGGEVPGGGDADGVAGAPDSLDVAGEVRRQLDGAYRAAHDEVLRELDSERYERLLDSLQDLLQSPGFTKRASRPALKVLPGRVAHSYDALAKLVARAQDTERGADRDELLHEARKAAKQVRYAAESIASVFGKDATRFARAVTELQEVLGEHQDSVVTRQRLRDLAGGDVTPAVAFAYGRLYAEEQVHAAASEADVADAWAALGAKRLHRWLR